jgi:hypothetical protein
MHVLVQTDSVDMVTVIKIRACGPETSIVRADNGDLTITVPGHPSTVLIDDATRRRHDLTREAA